ncbi:hypothetical protein D3C77_612940 [compost metagenome]
MNIAPRIQYFFPPFIRYALLTIAVIGVAVVAGVLRMPTFIWLGFLSCYLWYVALTLTFRRRKGEGSKVANFWECVAVIGALVSVGLSISSL